MVWFMQAAIVASKSEFWSSIKILRDNKGASIKDGPLRIGRETTGWTTLTATDERGVVFLFRFGTEPKLRRRWCERVKSGEIERS